MTDRNYTPLLLHRSGQPPEEVDRLLRDFFREEMPRPWPKMARPEERPARPTPARPDRWPGLRRQLGVAASVGLVLVGYLALARSFPGTVATPSPAINPQTQTGSNKDLVPKAPREVEVRPTHGGRARMWEQQLPGRRTQFFIEDIETPPSRR
jgi:hypothetical protein